MPAINPSPRTWTLRFKIARTTTLLHVDPLQKMHLVKAELLHALKLTHPDGTLEASMTEELEPKHTIPQNPDDLVFARPVDINDLSAGWEPLVQDDDGIDFEEAEGKGKGKAKTTAQTSTKSKAGKDNVRDCPQGAGLRDGGVVAVRFRTEDEKERRRKKAEEEPDVDEIAKEGLGGDDEVVWDVDVPTIEDTYGAEDVAAAEAAEVPLEMPKNYETRD